MVPPKIVTPPPPKPAENLPPKTVEPVRTPQTPSVVLPTFPNFDALDCANLKSQMTSLETTLRTSRFSNPNVRKAYENALLSAKTAYNKKSCAVKQPTQIKEVKDIKIEGEKPKEEKPKDEKPKEEEKVPAPVGGGGGGGGVAPAEEAPAEEVATEQPTEQAEPKKTNLLPILLIAGVAIYFLTRKS
jgi:hypothetical protein